MERSLWRRETTLEYLWQLSQFVYDQLNKSASKLNKWYFTFFLKVFALHLNIINRLSCIKLKHNYWWEQSIKEVLFLFILILDCWRYRSGICVVGNSNCALSIFLICYFKLCLKKAIRKGIIIIEEASNWSVITIALWKDYQFWLFGFITEGELE